MYVCLCKGLKEEDVVLATRAFAERGDVALEDVIEVLGLHCEEACGFCVEHPEHIDAIVDETMAGRTTTYNPSAHPVS